MDLRRESGRRDSRGKGRQPHMTDALRGCAICRQPARRTSERELAKRQRERT